MRILRSLILGAILLTGLQVCAQVPVLPEENFVRAYVMVADGGREMYSQLGHAFLRMSCPEKGLDFVFSCEGEPAEERYVQFFLGQMMMGTRAVPTEEYLKQYEKAHRQVHQYELRLPIHVKQRLWQTLDQHIMEPDIPYDYIEYGCATCVMRWIEEAAGDSIIFDKWPSNMQRSRAEMAYDSISNKWTHTILRTFTAGAGNDVDLPYSSRVTVPTQLPHLLSHAKYNGRSVLVDADSVRASLPADYYDEWTPTLSPLKCTYKNLFTQPMLIAFVCLLVALLGVRLKKVWVMLPVLILGALLSLFVTYLVVFQPIPNNEWNWLIVPFNILPFILWHWRSRWAKWYMTLTIVWAVGMLLAPHFLVDPAHILLAFAQAAAVLPLRKEERQRMK